MLVEDIYGQDKERNVHFIGVQIQRAFQFEFLYHTWGGRLCFQLVLEYQ